MIVVIAMKQQIQLEEPSFRMISVERGKRGNTVQQQAWKRASNRFVLTIAYCHTADYLDTRDIKKQHV